MNHHAPFIKLMHRLVRSVLLEVIEPLFASSITCVKWGSAFSTLFNLTAGALQDGVLSPTLFGIYIDDVAKKISACGSGCHLSLFSASICCYADDILLIASSVQSLQTLLHLCEAELIYLDMCINSKKSVCIRFGSRFDVKCSNITTLKGNALEWVGVCR